MEKSCKGCVFYDEVSKVEANGVPYYGRCKRYPPKFSEEMYRLFYLETDGELPLKGESRDVSPVSSNFIHPLVTEDDWCGEYKPSNPQP